MEGTTVAIGFAVATGVIVGGMYGLRGLGVGIFPRFVTGVILLSSAVAFWLLTDGAFVEQPVQLGLCAGFAGLGINQLTAPLRRAFGHAV